MKALSAFAFASIFIISCLGADASGWSWRDLKPSTTTEEEFLKNAGTPWEVKLLFPNYLKIKQGKPYTVSFTYYDSELHRSRFRTSESEGKPLWYDPSKIPILESAPIKLSHEITEIKFGAMFIANKLIAYDYTFKFGYPVEKIDTKKYIEIFNSLLGKPVSIRDISWIEYEGCYLLSIVQEQKEIWLQCIPGK